MKRLTIFFIILFALGCASVGEKSKVEPTTPAELEKEIQSVGLSEKSIKVGTDTIYYLEGGKGETILLLHGFGSCKEIWISFAKFFTPNYHVMAIDLPGHGKSTRSKSKSYDIATQADRLDKIANVLNLNKFHIVGNSMGGTIGGKYTIDFPYRVLSLSIFDGAGVRTPKPSDFIQLLEKGENVILPKSSEEFDRFTKYIFAKAPDISESIIGYEKQLRLSRQDFDSKIWQDLMSKNYLLEFELSKIKVETLILWGDKDRIIDISAVKIFQNGLSNSSTVIMKDCGHTPMLERPEEAAGHYIKFLNSL